MLNIVFPFLLAVLCHMGTNTNKTASGSSRYDFCSLVSAMGVHFPMFLFTALLVIAWPFAAQAKMFIDCTFGKITTREGQKMTAKFTANLTAFKHASHSCFVKTGGQNHQNHFLQVRAKRNKESKGEHMSIRFLIFF